MRGSVAISLPCGAGPGGCSDPGPARQDTTRVLFCWTRGSAGSPVFCLRGKPSSLRRLPAIPIHAPAIPCHVARTRTADRSEEHTSELQSLTRISYAVFCLKKKKKQPSMFYDTNIRYNDT